MSSAGAVSFPLSGDRRTARIRQASSFGGHHLRRSRTRPLCRPCCKSLSWIASPPKCWPLPTLSPAGPSRQSCPRTSARQSRVSSRYIVSLCDTAFSHPCIHAARSMRVPGLPPTTSPALTLVALLFSWTCRVPPGLWLSGKHQLVCGQLGSPAAVGM